MLVPSRTTDVMEIPVIYEDDCLLSVNKPAHLPVHHTPDADAPDLQSLVEARAGKRLILFHRLDRDTTGVVIFGKTRAVNKAMSDAFAEHRVRKCYWAVVAGKWMRQWNRVETLVQKSEAGGWENSLETGKRALTTFRVLDSNEEKSWLEVLPKTGRTHQIRLHCLHQGHPILGDERYGVKSERAPMALHAVRLDFRHPVTGESLCLQAPAPSYWRETWLWGFDVPERYASLIQP